MRKIIFIYTLLVILFFSGICFAENYLIKINNQTYTTQDFKTWWKYWKDKNTPFPKTPEPYIEWLLMAKEAKKMRLYESPSYKRKLEEFKKVRSLLWLKYEEIDSKIDLSNKRLWKEYLKNFSPLYKVYLLRSNNKKDILNWKNKIKTIADCKKLAKSLSYRNKAELIDLRPWIIPNDLKGVLKQVKKGDIIGPIKINNLYYLFCIEDKQGPSKKDFKKIKEHIAYVVRKKEEDELNAKLIQRLKKKYKVVVNKKILDAIKFPAHYSEEFLNEPVIIIENKKLPVKKFVEMLKREIWLRCHGRKPETLSSKELNHMKEFLVNSIIAQTLVGLEALNRRYEETKYKDLWEFYKKERLVKEFEAYVIWPKIKVTEEDMKRYYETHKNKYYYPERVTLAIIRITDKGLIKRIYREIQEGKDFFTVAKRFGFRVIPKVYPLNQLDPEIRKVVKKLNEEDVSGIFKVGEDYCIVKLIDREPEGYYPYQMVKNSIRNILILKKYKEERKKVIDQLKKYYKISVNEKAWKNLKKEMENEN